MYNNHSLKSNRISSITKTELTNQLKDLIKRSKFFDKEVLEEAIKLIKLGADVNSDKNCYTALHIAAKLGDVQHTKFLLGKGAMPLAEYEQNLKIVKTPLGFAEPYMSSKKDDYREVVKLLIEKIPLSEEPHRHLNRILYKACLLGEEEIVKIALSKGAKAVKGLPAPLQAAATNGHVEVGKLLLDQGFDVNERYDIQNCKSEVALTIAAEKGHAEFVQMLLDNGANVNLSQVRSSILIAFEKKQKEVFELLLANGAQLTKDEYLQIWKEDIKKQPILKELCIYSEKVYSSFKLFKKTVIASLFHKSEKIFCEKHFLDKVESEGLLEFQLIKTIDSMVFYQDCIIRYPELTGNSFEQVETE